MSVTQLIRLKFQSTRPVKGATGPRAHRLARGGVSIHAPREGRDALEDRHVCAADGFQSTRPVKGATDISPQWFDPLAVSIHAPREGRDLAEQGLVLHEEVSIHAPREGRDARAGDDTRWSEGFQSTRPVKGATSVRMLMRTWPESFNPRAP